MVTPTLTDNQSPQSLDGFGAGRPYWTENQRRVLARLAIAVAVSGSIWLLLVNLASPTLPRHIDIVGWPSYFDYNYLPSFWKYRLAVYVFPAVSIVLYALLSRWGPFRRTEQPRRRGPVELLDGVDESAERSSVGESQDGPWPQWTKIPRVLVPAAVVVVAAGSVHGGIGLRALASGAGYVALVALIAAAYARATNHGRSRQGVFWSALALVNGVGGCSIALLGLWYISAHTVVHTPTGDEAWPWFPFWLAGVGVVAATAWAVRERRRGRSARAIEGSMVTVVVGAVLLFLVVSKLPAPVAFFQGFDDAWEMTGSKLLEQGTVPWRDSMFVHGLWPDVLTGTVGRAVFGDTVWGVFAIHSVILGPLAWVILYLYACWISNANRWFAMLFGVTAVGASLLPTLLYGAERFIAVPIVLILLGETLRRRSAAWAVGMTTVLAVQAVLVPETSFVALAVVTCVVAAELVHRRPGVGIWRALRLTRWCAATGAVLLLVLAGILLSIGALGAFVEYYLVVAPGHNETGAMPASYLSLRELGFLVIEFGLVMATIGATAVRLARRGNWYARDWVGVATAGFMVIYIEKAIGRLDSPHVWQNFGAALPLVVYWAWRALHGLGRAAEQLSPVETARRRWPGLIWHPANAPLAMALALMIFAHPVLLKDAANGMAGQHRLTAVADTAYRLGYVQPGAMDPDLLPDLDVVLDTYAGAGGAVYDLTNSTGQVHYLLGHNPGTRFLLVALAVTPYAQQLVIDDLEKSRPAVVIFDAERARMGLAKWDDITNNVRHYLLSEYLLRNWTPVLRTHGALVMVRNDLAAEARPVPRLAVPPQVSDLYFSGPTCDWGAAANYLPVATTGAPIRAPVRPVGQQSVVTVKGWASDPTTGAGAKAVVVANGDVVIDSVTPDQARPDVASVLGIPTTAVGFTYSGLTGGTAAPTFYAEGVDGRLYPLRESPGAAAPVLTFADGRSVSTETVTAGRVESVASAVATVGRVDLPAGTRLTDYDLITLSSGSATLGAGSVAVTDAVGALLHDISARTLPISGPEITMRVGSCPQWYGYDSTRPLYIVQRDVAPITSVTLARALD
jgi:hypothetical protein